MTAPTRASAGSPVASPGTSHGGPSVGATAEDVSIERLARGARDNLAGIVVDRGLGLVLFVALPLVLGSAALGTFYEASAVIVLLAVAASLGLETGLVRFAALRSSPTDLPAVRRAARRAVGAALPFSLLVTAALWTAAPSLARAFGNPASAEALRIGAVAIPFLVVTSLLVGTARGLKRMGPTILAVQVVQPGIQLGATLALVAMGWGLRGAMVALTASAICSCAVAATLVGRLRLPAPCPGDTVPVRTLLGFSLPVLAMTMTGTALLWLDTVLLGWFRPPAEVGTYGIVVRLLTTGAVALVAIMGIFGPFAAQLAGRGDLARLQAVLRTATRWAVLVGGPLLALIAVGAPDLLAFFHQRAPGGVLALRVLAVAFVIDTFAGPVGHVLTMSGRPLLNVANNLVALVANVGLNLLLIPRFGLVGAAASWTLAIVGVNAARLVQVRRALGVTPFSATLIRPAAAILVASATGLAVTATVLGHLPDGSLIALAWLGGAFLTAYVGSLLALGTTPEDRVMARVVLGRSRPGEPVGGVA